MPYFRYCLFRSRLWLLLLWIATSAAAQVIPRHYRVQLAVRPKGLQADVTVQVHTTRAERVVTFSLADSLKIDNVAIEGQTYRPARIGPNRYTLLMVDLWPADTDHELTFHYFGTPPAPDHARPDDLLLSPRSGWYPQFDTETPFTTEVAFRAPLGVQAITRGQLEQENSSGLQTWVDAQTGTALGVVWKRGLAADEIDRPGLQIQAYCPTLAADDCSHAAAWLAPQLKSNYEFFSRRFGPPRRSRIVPVVFTTALASLQGGPRLFFVPLPEASWKPEQSLELAASISRLWWNLAPGSSEDQWLQQGLPIVTGLAAVAHDQGAAVERDCLRQLQATARGDAEPQPAADPPEEPSSASRIPAQAARAAMVLNALRLEIGAEPFEEALEAFHRTSLEHPEAATAAEFQKQVAKTAHTNLAWFWEQWLDSRDLPHIEFSWRIVRLPRSGQTVRVRVRQEGRAFGFRVPIAIVAGGKRYVQSIEVHNADTILGIPVRGAVDTVQFDPGEQLLSVLISPPSDKIEKHAARSRRHTKARSGTAVTPRGQH